MISDFSNKDYWLTNLLDASNKIDSFIDDIKNNNRKEVSENVLLCLRHFVEYSCAYVSIVSGLKLTKADTHRDVNNACLAYIASNIKKYGEFYYLHDLLQKSTSHEIVSFGDYAERLMQHFFSYLVRIKQRLFKEFGVAVLNNLKMYPLNLNTMMQDYYKVIDKTLVDVEIKTPFGYHELYYVHNKKTIYIKNSVLYEYTISIVNDNYDKADKMIAFSHINIFDNYAVELQTQEREIEVDGIKTKIDFIVDYSIRIRNCELEKISKTLRVDAKFAKTNEYDRLMEYIKRTRLSLANIVNLPKKQYNSFAEEVFQPSLETNLQKVIKRAREIVQKKEFGTNILLYLLATMNNAVLANQIPYTSDYELINTPLRVIKKDYPFETTPYCANLYSASISFDILLNAIPISEHLCELVKREIDNYASNEGMIYCPIERFRFQSNLQILVQQYNNRINNYEDSAIKYCCDKNGNQYLCAIKNEKDAKVIFTKIYKYLNTPAINQYRNYVAGKIKANGIDFDDLSKEKIILDMYEGRSIFAVYGPAGTGKSFLAKKVLGVLDTFMPLCLTVTYAAKDNLKRKIGSKKATFDVIEKVIKDNSGRYSKYDFLILDECSTISNSDMAKLLNKLNPKLILLLGDVYQIESISLGNWFKLYSRVFPKTSFAELDRCFRTKTDTLKEYWSLVRSIDDGVIPFMNNHFMTHPISAELFHYSSPEDTVTLCLNYGGLFGINSINRMMQSANSNHSITWRKHIYKVGDPVIFKENKFYKDIFYNNLKGIIKSIKDDRTSFIFTIEVFDTIEDNPITRAKTNRIDYLANGHTDVTFSVSKSSRKDYDNDIRQSCVIPFNIGYAISIHKAQGLEFDNVRLVVTEQTDELISHNIFYTAVTRAVKNVDVYWSIETQERVISSFSNKVLNNDVSILYKNVLIPSGLFKK